MTDPTALKTYLGDIVNYAKSNLAQGSLEDTPIFLFATAGMRLLPEAERGRIMLMTFEFFRDDSPFIAEPNNFRIISGEEEGLFSWLAVNFATNRLGLSAGHHSFGMVEMGGASAQLAYEPQFDTIVRHMNDLHTINLVVPGFNRIRKYVYVKSFLGYGVNRAREHYQSSLTSKKADGSESVSDPCLPVGQEENVDNVRLVGSGMFDKCLEAISPILNKSAECPDYPCYMNGIHAPLVDFSQIPLMGMAEFYYTSTSLLDGDDETGEAALTFDAYQRFGHSTCSRPRTSNESKPGDHSCFKAAWLVSFLYRGIEVGDKYAKLRVANIIDNIELSWTLGAVLVSLYGEILPPSPRLASSALDFLTLMAGGGFFSFFGFRLLRRKLFGPRFERSGMFLYQL